MPSFNTPSRLFKFAGNPPGEGLVAAWNLSTVNDSFGANNLTNNGGVTFVAGKINNCASFDGIDDNLNIADNAALSFGAGKKLSICGWFKMAAVPAVGAVILGKWNDSGFSDYFVQILNNGSFRFIVSTVGVDANIVASPAGTIVIGVWYFFVVWYDGNTINLELNNNGTIYSANYTLDIFNGTSPFRFGALGNDTQFYTGLIDAVRVYKHDNRVLTATERNVLYNNGLGREYVSQNIVLADEVNRELNQLVDLFNGQLLDTTPKLAIDDNNAALIINQAGAGSIAQFYNNGVLKSEIDNNGTLKSYLATGTAPIVMGAALTTRVDNLNADLLDDVDSSAILQHTSYIPLVNSVIFQLNFNNNHAYFSPNGDILYKIKAHARIAGSNDCLVRFDLYKMSARTTLIQSINLDNNQDVVLDVNIVVAKELYICVTGSFSGSVLPTDVTISFHTYKVQG